MNVNRRTQAERTAATRAALIASGRKLFGTHGYADVGTQAVVADAGVTRGALYHQFGDKRGLFTAVFDAAEEQLVADVVARMAETGEADPLRLLKLGIRIFLEAFTDSTVNMIVLVDAPAVLGWKEWRARGEQYGFAMVEELLEAAVDSGAVAEQPLRPLAHIAVGALDEAALYVSGADDPVTARDDVTRALDRVVDSFALGG
ncbi:TetR/AcrR family transcriptional regulator [Williamsia sterculiae]|uniref:Transcriptional regulator, TetR family n=1 Tax=Williamsia sterculiae TaxID=1344003 RepID=A0A1N7GY52_9NOCA|nr:TetR/AcrR family transcriptional regulator [Williamsia sterculiae]SIS17509.1 transcriptional regulator, TetR family [Williamsia sterculiae]